MSTRVLRLVARLNIGGPARRALLLTRELAAELPPVPADPLIQGSPPRPTGGHA